MSKKERGFQMKPIYSISATHGGQDKVSVPHNQRYNKYIQQAHIDPNGLHENQDDRREKVVNRETGFER